MGEFSKVEYLMILSYFRASLNQCYKTPTLTVTNVESQHEEDFREDIPKVDIRNAKSICKKCVNILNGMHHDENEEKDDIPEVPQENT